MIFDRTQSDVDEAIRLKAEKVQTFQTLTDSEIETLERGLLTLSTLNRIEGKEWELKNLFAKMGYYNTSFDEKVWAEGDFFSKDDIVRIVNAVDELRQAFFVYKSTPATPLPLYHYENLNAIEKILHDLDLMISDVRSFYKECGVAICGG